MHLDLHLHWSLLHPRYINDIYLHMPHSKIGKLRQWMSNWQTYMECLRKKFTWNNWKASFTAQGEEDKVCRLVHSLYRLKQAGWVWNRTFAHTIKRKLGFNTIHSDAGVYVLCHHHKRRDSEMDMILILYVDDLLLLGEDLSKIEDVNVNSANCIKCWAWHESLWQMDFIMFPNVR